VPQYTASSLSIPRVASVYRLQPQYTACSLRIPHAASVYRMQPPYTACSLRIPHGAVLTAGSRIYRMEPYYRPGRRTTALDVVLPLWTSYYRPGRRITALDVVLPPWVNAVLTLFWSKVRVLRQCFLSFCRNPCPTTRIELIKGPP